MFSVSGRPLTHSKSKKVSLKFYFTYPLNLMGMRLLNLNTTHPQAVIGCCIFLSWGLQGVETQGVGLDTPHFCTPMNIISYIQVSNIALGSLKAFGSDDKDLNEEIITLAFENGINFFDISEPFTSKKAEVSFLRLFFKPFYI